MIFRCTGLTSRLPTAPQFGIISMSPIAQTTGRSLAAPRGERRVGDPVRLVADTRLARRILQFNPTRSDLKTIIETAWRWHQAAHPAVEKRPESGSDARLPAVADR